MPKIAMFAAALIALPAWAQTTTTVETQGQTQPPPPPSTTTTTVQTQPQPTSSTQVVVNPNDTSSTTTSHTRVSDDATTVETTPRGRTTAVIVATDALYGGIAGLLVGGGITLVNQGSNWQRNLMIGAGVGILAGAAFGVYEAATQNDSTVVRRAAADPNPAASQGTNLTLLAGRF
jgi:hypothetical protein